MLSTVLVKAGEPVKKGQLLASIDGADESSRSREAQIGRDRAQREYTRTKKLVDQGSLPPAAADDAKSQLDSAEAALSATFEAVRRTRLFSPVDGTVFKRLAEPGETVNPGAPVLLVDETQHPLVKLGVTVRELPRLHPSQPATLTIDDTGATMPGEVTSVASTPDPADGLYPVEVVPKPVTVKPGTTVEGIKLEDGKSETAKADATLRLGALVTVRFEASTDETIRVPLEALVHRRDKDWVFVVDSSDKGKVNLARIGVSPSDGARGRPWLSRPA